MTADPADLAARIVEAAAIPIAEAADCGGGAGLRACVLTPPGCQCRRVARAALAAAVREAVLDRTTLRRMATLIERVGWGRDDVGETDKTAALLRALAGIADA